MRKAIKDALAQVNAPKPPPRTHTSLDKASPAKAAQTRAELKKKRGPYRTTNSQIALEKLLSRYASGEHLQDICKEEGMPPVYKVIDWALNPDEDLRPGFSEKFRRAEEIYHHMMAGDLIRIADDDSKDIVVKIVNGRPVQVIDTEHIQRSKLRIDTRLKVLSKKLKSIFGDEIQVNKHITIDIAARLNAAQARVNSREDRAYKTIEAVAEEVKEDM